MCVGVLTNLGRHVPYVPASVTLLSLADAQRCKSQEAEKGDLVDFPAPDQGHFIICKYALSRLMAVAPGLITRFLVRYYWLVVFVQKAGHGDLILYVYAKNNMSLSSGIVKTHRRLVPDDIAMSFAVDLPLHYPCRVFNCPARIRLGNTEV